MRIRWLIGTLAALGALAAAILGVTVGRAADTFTVAAGAESSDKAVQINEFIPRPFTVHVGDTVTWRVVSAEFHTVTFLSGASSPAFVAPGPEGLLLNPAAVNPAGSATYDGTGMANSGLLNQDQSYSLTFIRPGTFTYVCLVHPDMIAQVMVVDSGQPADTPAAVQARIGPQVSSDLATRGLSVILSNLDRESLQAEGSAPVVAGAGDGHVALMRFLPGNITIHMGEPITWINKDPVTPHTVTFLAGVERPDTVMPVPQQSGPPNLAINPEVLNQTPAESADYDGTTFRNSGFMGGEGPTQTFTLNFTEPGVFDYVCLLHDEMGMLGRVTVLP